jgi:hypothetical protein
MCQVQTNPGKMGHALACTCGCCGCGCGPWQRRFIAPVEEKEMLERYKDFLKNELAGLEARLKEVEA